MSNLEQFGLNTEEDVKGAMDFDALPDGDYQVVITEAEMKDNKNTAGSHVGATLLVIDGEFEGRLLWANYNIKNANPTAEKIGRAELAQLCQAIGIGNPKDTDELVNKPFMVKLGVDRKDNSRNKIKAYMALATAPVAPTTPAPASVAKPSAAKPATGAKPWQQKKK